MGFFNRKKNKTRKRTGIAWMALLAVLLVFSCVGCAQKEPEVETEVITEETTPPPETEPEKTVQELIGDALLLRGKYGEAANEKIKKIYAEVIEKDPEQGTFWKEIDSYWAEDLKDLELNYDELPYGLSDGDNLAIVILGYGLKSDGTMKDELIDRLQVGLYCSWEYPNAYIVCTGGGGVPNAKEADVMGQWLLDEGLEEGRLMIENQSMTTGQNAMNTGKLLQEDYPEVDEIAIVTSDYHIPWAMLLFKAETGILSQKSGREITVVAHAANNTGRKVNTEMSKAAGLLEILGDSSRAAEIYRKDYSSVPELD
ncbi:MAG: YdcF family protein [Lachnospiraceae bacterium]|nr:YdcF family protein [Lachnospiraceae bacterium]